MTDARHPLRRSLPNFANAIAAAMSIAVVGCDSKHGGTPAPSNGGSASASVSAAPAPPSPVAAQAFAPPAADAEFASLLREIVTDNGLVQYELLRFHERTARLNHVIEGYATWKSPPEDKYNLAFWINAYNANTLAMTCQAMQQPGFRTVKDVPGFFDSATISVGGSSMTLNDLQSQIEKLHDARAFAALVCGTRGSPPLRAEPYDAQRLEPQLNDQCRCWLEDQGRNRIARDGLMLSDIFRQHLAAFEAEPYRGVIGFVRKHGRPNGVMRDFIKNVPNLRISYIPYDWRVNQAPAEVSIDPAARP